MTASAFDPRLYKKSGIARSSVENHRETGPAGADPPPEQVSFPPIKKKPTLFQARLPSPCLSITGDQGGIPINQVVQIESCELFGRHILYAPPFCSLLQFVVYHLIFNNAR